MESEAGRGLQPEDAQKILEVNGLKLSVKQAALVLAFCKKIAMLSVKQLKREKS